MHVYSDLALSTNLGVTPRLKDAFLEVERDALFLRRALLLCAVLLTVGGLKMLHHMMAMPGASYIWDFIVSICT